MEPLPVHAITIPVPHQDQVVPAPHTATDHPIATVPAPTEGTAALQDLMEADLLILPIVPIHQGPGVGVVAVILVVEAAAAVVIHHPGAHLVAVILLPEVLHRAVAILLPEAAHPVAAVDHLVAPAPAGLHLHPAVRGAVVVPQGQAEVVEC